MAVPGATTGPEPRGRSPQTLELLLGSAPKRPKPDSASEGHLHPSLPPLHSRGDWDLRDRKLFGPQSYFRYFL